MKKKEEEKKSSNHYMKKNFSFLVDQFILSKDERRCVFFGYSHTTSFDMNKMRGEKQN